jgi:protein-S-isoprenylcysteine O-methyltransferase Ste14
MKILHITLRPLFGICLLVSQFFSHRNTFFTDNLYILSAGVIIFLSGIFFLLIASSYIKKAVNEKKISVTGPYKYIRHPIYTGIYILSTGLGLIFFARSWFIVMIVFIPLWYLECRSEEKEMIKIYGEDYIKYCKTTGMFLPVRLK